LRLHFGARGLTRLDKGHLRVGDFLPIHHLSGGWDWEDPNAAGEQRPGRQRQQQCRLHEPTIATWNAAQLVERSSPWIEQINAGRPTQPPSNYKLFGVIFISADKNPLLRDRTNRDGLHENQASPDLRGLMLEVLVLLEPLRHKAHPCSWVQGSTAGEG